MTEPACECGWKGDIAGAGHCRICHEDVPVHDVLGHFRVMHPDLYGDGPARWPDGGMVIEEDLTPDRFSGSGGEDE